MSSQGPTTSLPKATNNIAVGTTGQQTSNLYSVDLVGMRDSSDWIKYKKRLLVVKENKARTFQDQGYVHGNNYRLDFLGGRIQVPAATCTTCEGSAYRGSGPF
jgi:hypothetical protein